MFVAVAEIYFLEHEKEYAIKIHLCIGIHQVNRLITKWLFYYHKGQYLPIFLLAEGEGVLPEGEGVHCFEQSISSYFYKFLPILRLCNCIDLEIVCNI